MTPKEMVKTCHFITLWCMFLLNAICVLFISTLYKTYGESEVVNDDRFLTTLGSSAAMCNAVGRILWGLFADKVSFKAAIVTLSSAMTCLMASLYITHVFAESAGKTLLFIWICLIFMTFSGNFSLFPTAIAKTFGPQYVSMNYGVLFTSLAVVGPIGALLSTFLFQKLHSYGIFILAAGLSFAASILGLAFNAKTKEGRPV
ncbi:hypothetical protein EB796_007980 [Bugula neritina]|uniref:Uncharacterized protein n=1 Tax=Bugula neritina TaxID=10212 RepID=A0A7J7K691_BUGNE|nr:hypothetical protein EB796_007980 [Bugula neritina]